VDKGLDGVGVSVCGSGFVGVASLEEDRGDPVRKPGRFWTKPDFDCCLSLTGSSVDLAIWLLLSGFGRGNLATNSETY
jgi:hypothetical protein